MKDRKTTTTHRHKPIPMLYGSEGKRFIERAKNPPKLLEEEVERMKKNYEIFKAAEKRGELERMNENLPYIEVKSAIYIMELSLLITFSNGFERVIDFSGFLKRHPHPRHDKYMKPANFKKFKVENGNISWGKNHDLAFPVAALYKGDLELCCDEEISSIYQTTVHTFRAELNIGDVVYVIKTNIDCTNKIKRTRIDDIRYSCASNKIEYSTEDVNHFEGQGWFSSVYSKSENQENFTDIIFLRRKDAKEYLDRYL